MPRPGDWDAIGLSSDPTPGDPDTINQLAGIFQHLGGKAREIYAAIEAVMNSADDSVFSGQTADALRGKVDQRLRGHVEDVAWAFESAAGAMRDWHGVVVEQQARADAALNAGRGLPDDDPERQRQADIARQAGENQAEQGRSVSGRIRSVSHIALPMSACEVFWDAFKWLAIILIIPALVFGGPIALLALGVNLTLFLKTVVDFANGDASFLDLFLAGLGMIAPTTKALPIFSILKGVGSAVAGGAKAFFQGFKQIFSREFLFSRLLPGLSHLPALATVAIRETGLFVVSGIKNLVGFGGHILNAGGLALTSITKLPAAIAKLPGAISRLPGRMWNGLVTGGEHAWKNFVKPFWDAHLGNGQIFRLILPIDAAEVRAFGFWKALKIGFFDRGVLGRHQFGAALTGSLGRSIAAVPINPPAVHTALGDGFTGLSHINLPPTMDLGVLRIGGDLGAVTTSGFHAAKQIDSLDGIRLTDLVNVRTGDLGISVTGGTTISGSGLHLPSTAGTSIPVNGVVSGLPTPGQTGLQGTSVSVLPTSTHLPGANVPPTFTNLPGATPLAGATHLPGTNVVGVGFHAVPGEGATNLASAHLPPPAAASIGDLIAPSVRGTTPTVSPGAGLKIGEGTTHGFIANQIRQGLDDLSLPTTHLSTAPVQAPTVDRLNAAMQLVDHKPAGVQSLTPPNGLHTTRPATPDTGLHSTRPATSDTGLHGVPSPGEAGRPPVPNGFHGDELAGAGSAGGAPLHTITNQPVNVPVKPVDLPGHQPFPAQAGKSGLPGDAGVPTTPGRAAQTDVPLQGVPDRPGLFVRVEDHGPKMSTYQMFGGGPNGRMDVLPGEHVRFTDSATGQTFRFDTDGKLVDKGVRLTQGDGVLRLDDKIVVIRPNGSHKVTTLAGDGVPESLTVKALDGGGLQVVAKDGVSWNYGADGRLQGQTVGASWEKDLAAQAGAFRKPGDSDAVVQAKMADFGQVRKAELDLAKVRKDLDLAGPGGPSGKPLGDTADLTLGAAKQHVDDVTTAFAAKHGAGVDHYKSVLDDLLADSVKDRPRVVGGGVDRGGPSGGHRMNPMSAPPRTHDLPAQVQVVVRDGDVSLVNPADRALVHLEQTDDMVKVTRSGARGTSFEWEYQVMRRGQLSLKAQSLPLSGGALDGQLLRMNGFEVGHYGGLVDVNGTHWPVKANGHTVTVGSPDGVLRYDQATGAFRSVDAGPAALRPAPVPPAHLQGADAARWTSSVELSRLHLRAAADDVTETLTKAMSNVTEGSFTNLRGYGGFIDRGQVKDLDVLVEKVDEFVQGTSELTLLGRNSPITLYRGVSLDPAAAQANHFLERLPSSTSSSIEFQPTWARHGDPRTNAVFEIDVPPEHGKLALSYPEHYQPLADDAMPVNPTQFEVTLAPTQLFRTGPNKLVRVGDTDLLVIPVSAKQLLPSEYESLIRAEWPGLSSAEAFDDFGRALSVDGLRRFQGMTDVTSTSVLSPDGLVNTIHVGKRGTPDHLLITVTRDVGADTVTVTAKVNGEQYFAKSWRGTDYAQIATDLKAGALNDNHQFLGKLQPARWRTAPEAIGDTWDADLAARLQVFVKPGDSGLDTSARMNDFVAVQRAQDDLKHAAGNYQANRGEGTSAARTVDDQTAIDLNLARYQLDVAKRTFQDQHGMSVDDLSRRLDELRDLSLSDRPRGLGAGRSRVGEVPGENVRVQLDDGRITLGDTGAIPYRTELAADGNVIVHRLNVEGGGIAQSWVFKPWLGGKLVHVGDSFPLVGGAHDGHSILWTVKNGKQESPQVTDAVGQQWPVRITDDGLVIASPAGPQRYALNGGHLGPEPTPQLPAAVLPDDFSGDAVRWTNAADISRLHLTEAADKSSGIHDLIRKVQTGRFTGHRGYGGFVKDATDQLLKDTEAFYKSTQDLLFKGPDREITLYRSVDMDKASASATEFVERVPSSTSQDLAFQVEWTRKGLPDNTYVFEIDVPAGHGKLAMSYPPGYRELDTAPPPLNQAQSEITLAPTKLIRTGPNKTVVVDGVELQMIPVRAEQIPASKLKQFLNEPWPGMPIDTAYGDLVRAFDQQAITNWNGYKHALVRSETTGDVTKLSVTRPGSTDQLTVTVTRDPVNETVSVNLAAGDKVLTKGPWKSTDLGDLAAKLRGTILHDSDEFLPLPRPASWPQDLIEVQVPGGGLTLRIENDGLTTTHRLVGNGLDDVAVRALDDGGYRVFGGNGQAHHFGADGTHLGSGHSLVDSNHLRGNLFVETDPVLGTRLVDVQGTPVPGTTVESLAGDGFRVTTGDTYRTYDAAGNQLADGFAVRLPGESGFVEVDVAGGVRRLGTDRQPLPAGASPYGVALTDTGLVRMELHLPNRPRDGEFHTFSRTGDLQQQGFPVVRNGRGTGFQYVVDHATGTWSRVGDDTTGAFLHGKVEVSGLENGRIKLLSSTGKPVEVFERRLLPDGTLLDSFRRTDTLGFGRFDRSSTWVSYAQDGTMTGWGQRRFDTTGSGWQDVQGQTPIREYREGLQKYHSSTGHVLATKNGDEWHWYKFDDHGHQIADGGRVRETIGDGWKDTYTRTTLAGDVVEVAQQKWGMWHRTSTAGQYQEFTLVRNANGALERPGTWEQLSRQGRESGGATSLDNGLLTVVRQGEQRPPVWVRESPIYGNERPIGTVAHLADDSRFQLFGWEKSGPNAGSGMRYVGADGSIVDVALDGTFVRSTGKLSDGTTLKVGDHATPPAVAHPQGGTPWEAGPHRGWRLTNGDEWTDVTQVNGTWVKVRESFAGGLVRQYPDHQNRLVWFDRDAHGNLSGLSSKAPDSSGTGQRYVVAGGAADSAQWRWYELDAHGVAVPGREGDRLFFRGSTDESLSWDDSFRDFDADGNLVRDRRMLDGGRYVESWQLPSKHWRSGQFDRLGLRVAGDQDLVRLWSTGDEWQQGWVSGSDHFRDVRQGIGAAGDDVFREVPLHLRDSPLRVREYQLDGAGRPAYGQWKEFDHGAVVRERKLSGQNYLETDSWRGQWKLYDADGRVIGERGHDGLVFELRGDRLTLTGSEYDFRGPLTEMRGWGRRLREPQRAPWLHDGDWTFNRTTLMPNGNPALREAAYAPYPKSVAQKAMIEFGQEFLLEFTSNLIVNAIVAEAQGRSFTGKDALKALMNAGVSSTIKTGLSTALNETKIGGALRTFRQGQVNVDAGKHWNRRPLNHDRLWTNEWTGNESATRWRGGTYDFGFNFAPSLVSGFVNGTMNASIFGITTADGHSVKLSGGAALGDGGINALASLTTGVSTALVKTVATGFGGGRFFHRQGFADFWLQLPFRVFEKSIQGIFLTSAYRASINPDWYASKQPPPTSLLALPPGVTIPPPVPHASGLVLPAGTGGTS
ncbi:hypothetical protein ACQPXM_01785 [Kribbella sp. CA-253562]|uniref:hypothetical protein n=1 Tax=Kribbella sp. CA-253562 TaxID=3239942 RepID=UPI003D8B469C